MIDCSIKRVSYDSGPYDYQILLQRCKNLGNVTLLIEKEIDNDEDSVD